MRSKAGRELFIYWNALRGARTAPLRDEIQPGSLRSILPSLFILESVSEQDIRFRLAGTHLCGLFGRELRGTSFGNLWRGEQIDRVERVGSDVMATASPCVISAIGHSVHDERVALEAVMLPLATAPGTVNRIIGSFARLARIPADSASPLLHVEMVGLRLLGPDDADAAIAAEPLPGSSAPTLITDRADEDATPGMRRVLHLRVLEGGRQN